MILLLALLALQVQAPPHNHGPTPLPPCQSNPSATCHVFSMTIDGGIRMFTTEDLGKNPNSIDMYSVCYGRLSKGSLRFYSNGTAPSSLVGILMPALDPSVHEETLEPDNTIVLYDRNLIMNFKATQANWGGAELSWECTI